MPQAQKKPIKIEFGEVGYISEDKGAFVKGLSEEKEDIFISDEVIQALKDQSQHIFTGQMVQIEFEGDDVIEIKPLLEK